MTEEENKNLLMRKESNQKEFDRLKEISKEFDYLLDGERASFLKELYYEYLLTSYEINNLNVENKKEYVCELLKELNKYRESLKDLATSKNYDITKKLKNF